MRGDTSTSSRARSRGSATEQRKHWQQRQKPNEQTTLKLERSRSRHPKRVKGQATEWEKIFATCTYNRKRPGSWIKKKTKKKDRESISQPCPASVRSTGRRKPRSLTSSTRLLLVRIRSVRQGRAWSSPSPMRLKEDREDLRERENAVRPQLHLGVAQRSPGRKGQNLRSWDLPSRREPRQRSHDFSDKIYTEVVSGSKRISISISDILKISCS